MINDAITKIIARQNLSYIEAKQVMNEIMTGQTSQIQTAAFLAALETKEETIEEITACAAEMREHATQLTHSYDLVEIVGTGGDNSKSFNISTTSSIVIAAAGIKVAKHGNRAASSSSGAADCLEALGVNISLSPEQCIKMLQKIGICFLFAQKYHTAMKYVAPVRKELKTRTIFNILGPLTNPAKANRQVLGVYNQQLVEPLAHVLYNLGVERGMSVYGNDHFDEISASSPTTICEFNKGMFRTYTFHPEDYGIKPCNKQDVIGGTPEENAAITKAVLSGEQSAYRTAVLLNAGAGIYIGGGAENMGEGIKIAAYIIDSGLAKQKLIDFIGISNEVCV